jgi:hypothetical protein
VKASCKALLLATRSVARSERRLLSSGRRVPLRRRWSFLPLSFSVYNIYLSIGYEKKIVEIAGYSAGSLTGLQRNEKA